MQIFSWTWRRAKPRTLLRLLIWVYLDSWTFWISFPRSSRFCTVSVPAIQIYFRSSFQIQLHVRGFSSQRITSMIHFLSSVCVCVWTIWIDVKLLICRGPPRSGGVGGQWRHPPGTRVNVPASSGPGRQTPSVGAVAGHCCGSPWAPSCAAGMSQYIYIHIYKSFLLGLTVLSLHVRCFPHQQFDKTFLSKCVTHAGSVKVVWALRGKPF